MFGARSGAGYATRRSLKLPTFPLHGTGKALLTAIRLSKTQKVLGDVTAIPSAYWAASRSNEVLLHRTRFPAFDDQLVSPLCYR